MEHYTICLTKERYKVINVISTIFILIPGLMAVTFSISCLMQRIWFKMPDFTIDVSFFLYRVIVAMALLWVIFESIISRQLYGFEKSSLFTTIWYVAMTGMTSLVIYWTGHGTANWDDLWQFDILTPILLIPLVMLSVVAFTMAILAIVLIVMFVCDFHSWRCYDRSEADAGRESQSFVIFCRDNS